MKIYYAPLESITGYPLRNAHHVLFPGIDKYYTPFLSANESGRFTGREGRDIAPGNNVGIPLIPQLLGKNSEQILRAVETMHGLGYREVNLNLGCPSGTVTAKGKGAGMLRDLSLLDSFFEELFEGMERSGFREAVRISVKTRLGIYEPSEAEALVRIYNRYPISELIVHARVLRDMYRNPVSLEGFSVFYENAEMPLVYNGDICSREDYLELLSRFPDVFAVMLGRGLVGNPALAREIRGGAGADREELRQYTELLLRNYQEEISGERNILFKLKENWSYLYSRFAGAEKCRKELRKASTLLEYKAAVRRTFAECSLLSEE